MKQLHKCVNLKCKIVMDEQVWLFAVEFCDGLCPRCWKKKHAEQKEIQHLIGTKVYREVQQIEDMKDNKIYIFELPPDYPKCRCCGRPLSSISQKNCNGLCLICYLSLIQHGDSFVCEYHNKVIEDGSGIVPEEEMTQRLIAFKRYKKGKHKGLAETLFHRKAKEKRKIKCKCRSCGWEGIGNYIDCPQCGHHRTLTHTWV